MYANQNQQYPPAPNPSGSNFSPSPLSAPLPGFQGGLQPFSPSQASPATFPFPSPTSVATPQGHYGPPSSYTDVPPRFGTPGSNSKKQQWIRQSTEISKIIQSSQLQPSAIAWIFVSSNDVFPPNAINFGNESNQSFSVCRSFYENQLRVGKVFLTHEGPRAFVFCKGKESQVKDYEVLVQSSAAPQFSYAQTESLNLSLTPRGAQTSLNSPNTTQRLGPQNTHAFAPGGTQPLSISTFVSRLDWVQKAQQLTATLRTSPNPNLLIPYAWFFVDHGVAPSNAIACGNENSQNTFFCRSFYEGQLHYGTVVAGSTQAVIVHNGHEAPVDQYEVLVQPSKFFYSFAPGHPRPSLPGDAKLGHESELSIIKRGAYVLSNFLLETGIPPHKLVPGPFYTPPPALRDLPVGIIGAGAAGLYTAMMLDSLCIKYEILEGSGRHGGRILTHEFTKELPGTPYQYFECGAMRFPDVYLMRRTFDLARKRLGMGADKFIEVITHNDQTIKHFNGISVSEGQYSRTDDNGKISADTFKVGRSDKNKDGYIPQEYLDQGTSKLYNLDTLGPLRQYFVDAPFAEAFLKLMRFDKHSVRSYMREITGYPDSVIRWIETMQWKTGGFDLSLTESVLASLSFDDPKCSNPKWYCFNGGTHVITDSMVEKVKTKPKYHKRVTAIKELPAYDNQAIEIQVDTQNPGRRHTESGIYSNIISTLPLSVLRTVDLEDIYLSVGQKNALRELQYQPSVKIGIQFKSAWWEKLGIKGGQTTTDRLCRSIVYPSYGPGMNGQHSNVLIAAYNGLLDSQRLAVYMKGYGSSEEKILLDIVMKDLAAIHKKPVDELWDDYLDYFAWDWYGNTFSQGAFAWFGPGQFQEVYPHLTMPAGKQQRLFFAGDAVSTCHGWLVGALNSAWRCVHDMLIAHPELNPNPNEDIVRKFVNEWGESEESDEKHGAKHVYLSRELFKRQQQLV